MLEHLDADDAVEDSFRREVVHIRSHDTDVLRCIGFDIAPLRRGVRDRRDAAVRIRARHVQGERAPPAAQLQDILPILEFGPRTGELEHADLGPVEVLRAVRPECTAVLQVRAQYQGEEFRRKLVVLFVRLIGGQSDRALSQLTRERLDARGGGAVAEALLEEVPNAEPKPR